LSPDEAYYWLWTRPLQLSYFDHPGMVAWWMWAGIHVFGDTAFGARFPVLVSTLLVTALVWDAARIAWQDRAAAARAALWLNATLLFGVAGILMTPDTPLILFAAAVLWAILRLHEEGRARWLYVAGLGFGLGAISKYTMGLLVPGALVTFLAFPRLRHWFASIHLWLALALGALCTLPVFIWNSRNDWASFAKQSGHAFTSDVAHPLANLGGFLASEVAIVTPILFVFVVWAATWALVAGWRHQRADWFLLGATSLPVLIFFAIHALTSLVQAHWPGPAYLGATVAATGAPMVAAARGHARRWIAAAPILGLAITGLVYFQAATALLPIPVRIDITKHLGDAHPLAAAVQQARQAHPDAFLLVTKHETAGLVSFDLPDHAVTFEIDSRVRPSTYDAAAVAALKGHDAIVIATAKDELDFLPRYFNGVTPLGSVALHWGGRRADQYRLVLAQGYRGGLIVQGDGYPGQTDNP
jgi:4-amino-4-deoxy-L-arabinose transferase-like glycosyltransferase